MPDELGEFFIDKQVTLFMTSIPINDLIVDLAPNRSSQ